MTQLLAARDAGLPASPREHLSSPVTRAVLRLQHRMLAAAREFLCGQGFVARTRSDSVPADGRNTILTVNWCGWPSVSRSGRQPL